MNVPSRATFISIVACFGKYSKLNRLGFNSAVNIDQTPQGGLCQRAEFRIKMAPKIEPLHETKLRDHPKEAFMGAEHFPLAEPDPEVMERAIIEVLEIAKRQGMTVADFILKLDSGMQISDFLNVYGDDPRQVWDS